MVLLAYCYLLFGIWRSVSDWIRSSPSAAASRQCPSWRHQGLMSVAAEAANPATGSPVPPHPKLSIAFLLVLAPTTECRWRRWRRTWRSTSSWREVVLLRLIPVVPHAALELERETKERCCGRDLLITVDFSPNCRNSFRWALAHLSRLADTPHLVYAVSNCALRFCLFICILIKDSLRSSIARSVSFRMTLLTQPMEAIQF
ncbi:uncharacterized protein LOC119299527 [Triticum dicoccoides]|uniref:uncharacterized protein LOC119299527 n=1 Tax=Triticum dicoccoides TaxID=85692 RepID=UPI00188F64B0|nr:uncharacterized protein LOC119299527 [Triticum dicoccoides]